MRIAVPAACAALVLTALAAPGQAAPDAAARPKPITINLGAATGPTIDSWGYDIKQPGKASALAGDPALRQTIFTDDQMSVLRIPIYANSTVNPGPGRLRPDEPPYSYQPIITAVKKVQKEKKNVQVFASPKLVKGDTFARWVRSGKRVKPHLYADLLTTNLLYLKHHGVTVDVLGVDNEASGNKGQITPSKYATIVSDLRANLPKEIKRPRFIAPEDVAPRPEFLRSLQAHGDLDTYAIAGTHFYTKRLAKQSGPLKTFGQVAASQHKARWNSEFHWNQRPKETQLQAGMRGLTGLFRHFDVGFTGVTWWNFKTHAQTTAQLQTDVVTSTAGARPFAPAGVTDWDGTGTAVGTLITRAFYKAPHKVTLWVINDTDRTQSKAKIHLKNGSPATRAVYTQWVDSSAQATSGNAAVSNGGRTLTLPIPAHSIELVTITLS